MSQSSRRRRRQGDDPQDDLTQLLQNKTRRPESKTTLKRGLSTVEEEDENETSDTLFVKETAPAAKKAKSRPVKETKFEATVRATRDELRTYLEGKVEDMERSEEQFQGQMRRFLASSEVMHDRSQNQKSKEPFYTMLAAARRVIQASSDVDKNFGTMVAAADGTRKELQKEEAKNDWEKEKKSVIQILDRGMRLSMKRIDQLVPDTAKAGKAVSSINISSDSSCKEVSGYFHDRHPQDKRLRETLVQTTKGIRRIVRSLPEQEDA